MSTPFAPTGSLIVVQCVLAGPAGSLRLKMAVDTGASQTIIDLSNIPSLGLDPNALRSGPTVVTASGLTPTWSFAAPYFQALGWQRTDFRILTFGLPSALGVDGLLGLDFFRDHILTIDMHRGEIDMSPGPSASVTP